MSSANSRSHDAASSAAPAVDRTPLFKQDRPRHIDRYISFFGDGADDDDAASTPSVAWSSES